MRLFEGRVPLLRRLRSTVGVALALFGSVTMSHAQSVVKLSDPHTEVVDTTLRGGEFAATNLSTDLLATRASDNPTFRRHALLEFDTERTIPPGATITSAKLRLVVHWGGVDDARRVGAFYVRSFDDQQATWTTRNGSSDWSSPGGDLSETPADESVVGNDANSAVTFDLTDLVQSVVDGTADSSSRYTRVALVDMEESARSSYRDYYSSEADDASLRPSLTITYTMDNRPDPPQPPPPASDDPSTLRVLHWNTHHGGYATDGSWNPEALIAWIAKLNPDVVSLNEVEENTGWSHGESNPDLFVNLLRKATGVNWHVVFVVGAGGTSGIGNAILSKTAFESTSTRQLNDGRAAVQAAVKINGRTVNLFSTHLDDKSSLKRRAEIEELLGWADGFSESRIIAGDFNASESTTEHDIMTRSYVDAWSSARSKRIAVAYPGNTAGNTRNGRIDYIFTSKGASKLELEKVQVFDTRNSNGVMPSDHRPVLAVYTLN